MAISVASVSPLSYTQELASLGHRPGPALVVVPTDAWEDRDAEVANHLVHRTGLTSRDVRVLRLLAEGWTTAAIAHELVYAESTIKKEVHLIVHRLGARNRTHAVALAVRGCVI
jgi:DNA-binding NarL/FixJ family response regulator